MTLLARERLHERLHEALDGKLDGFLRTNPFSRALWSADASIYKRNPVAVAVVRSGGDVKAVIDAAREVGVSITPRGTGTSLAGQATAPGITLDTSEMQGTLQGREQIRDGTGGRAIHPAEYLANCLRHRNGRDGH